jgi:hypothetical protein
MSRVSSSSSQTLVTNLEISQMMSRLLSRWITQSTDAIHENIALCFIQAGCIYQAVLAIGHSTQSGIVAPLLQLHSRHSFAYS